MTLKLNTFLGLGHFPEDVQSALEGLQHLLSCNIPSHLWEDMTLTASHNYHITLKFMGYMSRPELSSIDTHLQQSRFKKFPLSLGKINYFHVKNTAYVWVGPKHNDPLVSFQHNLDNIVQEHLGMPLKGTYTPHITLLRLKNASEEDMKKIMAAAKNMSVPALTWTPSKYHIYQTEHDADGHKVYLSALSYPLI